MGPSAEALAYIYGAQQPQRDQTIKQDVAAATINGELFDLPGGAAAVAFGAEWRKEQIGGTVDPQFNSGWLYGNYLVNRGKYTRSEEHTSELQSLMRNTYAVLCLKKKKNK